MNWFWRRKEEERLWGQWSLPYRKSYDEWRQIRFHKITNEAQVKRCKFSLEGLSKEECQRIYLSTRAPADETYEKILEFVPFSELPKYVNHPNQTVREMVKKRLSDGY